MPRLYDDFQYGLMSADLSATQTIITSAGFTDMRQVIAGQNDYITIVIDPDSATPEIAWVVEHVTNSTAVTLERGKYGTTATAHSIGAAWVAPILSVDMTHPGVQDRAIQTSWILDAAITTAKIADGAITPAKMANPTRQVFEADSQGNYQTSSTMKVYVGSTTPNTPSPSDGDLWIREG